MWFLFLMFFMVFIFLGMASWETILIVACFTFLFIVPLLCIIKTSAFTPQVQRDGCFLLPQIEAELSKRPLKDHALT